MVWRYCPLQTRPRWYEGFAFSDWSNNRVLMLPIPINLLVALAHAAYLKVRYPRYLDFARKYEKRIGEEVSRARAEGFTAGHEAGVNATRSEEHTSELQ